MDHDLHSVLDRLVHRKNELPGAPRVASTFVSLRRGVLFSVLSLPLILLETLSAIVPGGRRDELVADQWSGYDAQ